MRSAGRLFAAVVLASLLVAACSDSDDGDDSAAPTSAVTEPASAGDPSPAVQNQRDVRGFMNRPCEILTATQVAALGIENTAGRARQVIPEVGDLANTQECRWGSSAGPATVAVAFDPDHDLLGGTIDAFSTDPVFEHIQIDGLAAVRHQSFVGSASCIIVVGIADAQGMNVDYIDNREPYEDPCGTAERAAAAAVSNLPPLQ